VAAIYRPVQFAGTRITRRTIGLILHSKKRRELRVSSATDLKELVLMKQKEDEEKEEEEEEE